MKKKKEGKKSCKNCAVCHWSKIGQKSKGGKIETSRMERKMKRNERYDSSALWELGVESVSFQGWDESI